MLAARPSRALARFLRDHRKRLGWTLREVEERSEALGELIPFTTVCKIERGKSDPGVRRLQVLLRVFDLPAGLVQDIVELEAYAGKLPKPAPWAVLHQDAMRHWKAGDLQKALGCLAAVRLEAGSGEPATRLERQRALLSIAIAVGSLGRYRLSRHMVEELLLAGPEGGLVVPLLVQAGVCWHRLGSAEVALGFLSRAVANASAEDHRQGAWIAHERASCLVTMRRFEGVEQAIAEAIEAYRGAGDGYGANQVLGVRVRMQFERGDFEAACAAARKARAQAKREGFERLVAFRALDEGRALVRLGDREAGLAALTEGLGQAIRARDHVGEFFAHYYLWKAHEKFGDERHGAIDLVAAHKVLEFIDITEPEAQEVRRVAGVAAGVGKSGKMER